MRKLQVLIVFFYLVILSCNSEKKNSPPGEKKVNEPAITERKIEVKVFRNDTIPGANLSGFGYNIIVDGNPYVHQPHIPAASGLKGFQTEDDARKTGEFACKKFKMTNTLPIITVQELDSLGIKY